MSHYLEDGLIKVIKNKQQARFQRLKEKTQLLFSLKDKNETKNDELACKKMRFFTQTDQQNKDNYQSELVTQHLKTQTTHHNNILKADKFFKREYKSDLESKQPIKMILKPVQSQLKPQKQKLKSLKGEHNENFKKIKNNQYQIFDNEQTKMGIKRETMLQNEKVQEKLLQSKQLKLLSKSLQESENNPRKQNFKLKKKQMKCKVQKICRYDEQKQEAFIRKQIRDSIKLQSPYSYSKFNKKYRKNYAYLETNINKSLETSYFLQQNKNSQRAIIVNCLSNNNQNTFQKHKRNTSSIHKNAQEYINSHKNKHFKLKLRPIQHFQQKSLTMKKQIDQKGNIFQKLKYFKARPQTLIQKFQLDSIQKTNLSMQNSKEIQQKEQ